MLKIKPIRNFILLKYKRPELIVPSIEKFSEEDKNFYLDCQEVLFYRTIEQIQYFHPKSHIHVLTNETIKSCDNISYYIYNESWVNHICKFKLYSLINEPAMYVDLDVVFSKPVPSMENYSEYPFYFFNISHGENIQKYSNKKLPNNNNITYNSGMVWINKPHNNITERLINLHETYFNDAEMILSKNSWPNNDEHALSLLVAMEKLHMPLNDKINVSRNKLSKITLEEISKLQSIHYTGILNKQKMIKEYNLFTVSKQHHNINIKHFFNIL